MKLFLSAWTPQTTINWAAAALLAAAFACSDGAGAPNRSSTLPDTSGSSNTSATSATGASATGVGGTQPIDLTTSTVGSGGTETTVECDPTGMTCTCITVALIGRLGTYGASPGADGTASMETWLNTNSNGDAATFLTKPTFDEAFLSQYDVIILQALENTEGAGQQWQFSAEELAAFEAWVRAGGGVIALTGYGALPDEATPTNTLLAFSGLQYAGLSGAGDTMAGESACPDECCYCYGSSIPTRGWDPNHPIAANMSAVGAFYGRSITVPANGQVVAQEGSTVYGATVDVDMGRVFMFHDEWVTYNSQWTGAELTDDCRTEDPTWSCYNRHPINDYQLEQFWYNALKWVSNRECFDVSDDLPVIK